GLLGHLTEMCEGSGLSARIEFDLIPKFDFLQEYLDQKSTPGGTTRNWDSYGSKISPIQPQQRSILADPQTSGGLLIAVDEGNAAEFEALASRSGLALRSFGKLIPRAQTVIEVV